MCPILGDLRGTNVWFCELIFFFFFVRLKIVGRYGLHSALCPRARPPLRSAGLLEAWKLPRLLGSTSCRRRSQFYRRHKETNICIVCIDHTLKQQLITGGASTPQRNVQTQHSPNVKVQKFFAGDKKGIKRSTQ